MSDKIKTVIARVDYDLWKYIKKFSYENEISISKLVTDSLIKFKKNNEKKLQKEDSMLS